MTKNPFQSVNKLFRKGANSISSTAKSIFSKANINTFRDHLSGVLQEQSKILTTVGKIGVGIALPAGLIASAFVPGALPLIVGAGLASGAIGGVGMLEGAGGNLLQPKLYKGKNKLQTTGAVVNEIEKSAKGTAQIVKFT